jgi:pre-mRNA-splicing factor SPF27
MAQEVNIDALPYIDQGYDEPGVREAVYAMIEEETKSYKPTKNYLEHLPPLRLHDFETDLIKAEMERMEERKPLEQLNMKRYELPDPPANKINDLNAWSAAVDNSMSQLEHQSTRIANLTVMNKYGTEAWKTYNTVLNQTVTIAQKRVDELKKTVQEVNWQRKADQLNAGEKLKNLNDTWNGLVTKNFAIEQCCVDLETEIAQIKTRLNQP